MDSWCWPISTEWESPIEVKRVSSGCAVEREGLLEALEQAAEGIVITDASGKIEYVNPAFTALTGYSSEEAVGRNPRLLKSGRNSDALYEELWSTILSGRVWHGEVTNRHKDGSFYDEEMRIAPVRDSTGKTTGYIAVKHDVTERRAAQDAQAFLAAIVEGSEDAILAYTLAGTILTWNGGAEAIFGYSAEEVIGRQLAMLVAPVRQPYLPHFSERLSQGSTVSQFETLCVRKDGQTIHASVTGSSIVNSAGEVTAISLIVRDVSERRKSEQRLCESEERFRTMADGSPSMMWVTDAEGRVEFMNRSLRKFYGIESTEANGVHWDMPIHPDDLPKSTALFVQAMNERKSFKGESRVRRADGEWRLLGTNAEPRLSPNGEYLGHIGLCADITERKLSERELRNSEERFRAVFEHAPYGMCVTGLDGRFTQVNEAYCKMLGYSEQELLGMSWSELTHPEDMESSLRTKGEISRNPGGWEEVEKRYIHRNGSVVWVHIKIAVVQGSDGAPLCHVVHVEDITERRRTEQALRESEARFRAMADGCPTPIWVTDAQGGIQFTNRTFREFCGVSHELAEGHKWRFLIHPDDLPEFVRETNRAVQTHTTFKAEARVQRSDGEWRWIIAHTEPRFSASGEFLGHVGLSTDITERKLAEAALSESRHLLQLFVDHSPVALAMFDREMRYLAVSQRWVDDHAAGGPEILGRSHYEVNPEVPERWKETHRRGMAGESQRVEEDWYKRADGSVQWIRWQIEPWRVADGSVGGIVLFYEDITERKQAELALKNSEEKFRQLAENIREVFWMMNAAGTEILYVGPAYEEIWGRSCKSLYENPMDWMEAIHRDDRERAHETFMRQLQGESIDSEYRISTPDGKQRWIRDRAFPVRDQSGELIRIAGIAEDITERRQAEILLRRTADRLTLATRAGGVGTWENDLVHGDLVWDEQMFRLYGISRDQFGGAYEAWLAGLHPEDRQRMDEDKEAAIRGEREVDGEFRVIWPDKSIHHIRALAMVKRDDSGKAIGLVGTNWDITAQKHAADALLESNRQLEEETVRANQLALAAEEANAAKSQFLANMSHEIRTPMNGVLGMIELLLDTDLTKEQRQFADTVRASGESLMRLINDILDFSKIEAKKLDLEAVDFDIQNLLDSLASVLAAQAQSKGIELLCIVDPAIPTILRGDSGRLRQILTNLAGNAIKFTEKGEVVIRATLEHEGESDCLLHFSVRDSGIGISDDKIGILFDKFTQVDTSTTRRFGGTGLGLAISKRLVEMMGGEISVASQEGKGSEFCFTARLGRGAQSETWCTDSDMPANLNGVRVLIVDDSATSREILAAYTTGWGMRTTAVVGGPWALEALYRAREEQDPFQVAVIDFHMPGMDGETLAWAIRLDKRLSETRMVMLTCLGAWHGTRSAEEIGLAGCATKPVHRDELRSLLCRVFPAANGSSSENTKTPDTKPLPLDAHRNSSLTCLGMKARILVVEDNAANQAVALGMLRKLGLHADAVSDGVEAIKTLETVAYDLILMDMRMPVMDGVEATRHIRNPEFAALNCKVPIVAMTANAMESDRQLCLSAGMNDFVSKPVSAAVMRDTLRKWLPSSDSVIPTTASPRVSSRAIESEMGVFDPASVLSRLEGDTALAQIVFAAFLEDLPRQIQALKMHVADRDEAGTARQAHSIRGASANVGGESLRRLSAEMEKAADAGDWLSVISRMDELERQSGLLEDAINRFESVDTKR
jgi:PAS domain S-box-containing protein